MQSKFVEYLKKNKWLVLLLVVAALLRIYKLNLQSPWLDELYTLKISNPNDSFGTMITEINNREGFPYLYFAILKIMFSIFGYTALVARLFSVVLGVASVFMIYKFGRLLYTKNVGLLAAALVTFSEYCIYTSQDARPYTFYFFAVLLSFYGMVRFIRLPNLKNALMYGAFSGVLLNCSFFGFINLFSQALILLLLIAVSPRENRFSFFKNALIAGCIAVVSTLR